jgi:PKD repeat protein
MTSPSPRIPIALGRLIGAIAVSVLIAGCGDDAQSPAARPEPPAEQDAPDGSMLAPLDLVYVCGNKFLATNGTPVSVRVTYRVLGTGETGSLTLPKAPNQDPAHSETELEAAERGVVVLYRDDQAVARRRNQGVPCGPSAISASVSALGTPETAGEWAAPFPWPVVGLHLSLLPNGRVLSWGSAGTPQVWDPTTEKFASVPSPSNLFCSGHAFLSDGRLLVAGGHISNDHGLPDINLFAPGSQDWSSSTPMLRGRWYPTATTLGSGEVVIVAGRDQQGVVVNEPEVWSAGAVRVLTGASRTFPYYPRSFLAPNGKVFYAGEQQTTRYLNTLGTGSWTTVGSRRYGVRDYGAAVMYDRGKILYVGGGRTTNTAEIIDLNAAAPTWQWTGSMAFPRRHLNATVLPTGQVLVTGGTGGTGFNDISAAVYAAELWDPTTGVWTTLASNAVARGYHSTSLLLPDGRVLHTGSGNGAGAPDQLNAELFSPPYLFKGPRPTIDTAPAEVAYGTSFTIATAQAAAIAKVSLVRLGSTTHAFNMNQRFQWLSFTYVEGGLEVSAPASRYDAPPGHYMLFILDGNGVPSAAVILRVGSDAPPPSNIPPTARFVVACSALSCAFSNRSTDADGTVTAWSWKFGDGGTSTARNPSHPYAAAGTYAVSLTVTDDVGGSQERVSSMKVTSTLQLSLTSRADATRQYVTLTWSGAAGGTVDIYRNGVRLSNTPNDGNQTIVRTFVGAATYAFKVCEAGSTACSKTVSATFP